MNNNIPFYKMSGSGNDFILIDNREGIVAEAYLKDLIVGACRRRLSVGADGLILIEECQEADFKWRFFNADGSRAGMCGNGARCAARFAHITGIAGSEMSFITDVGRVAAEIITERVKINMTDPTDHKPDQSLLLGDTTVNFDFMNTGVPHAVILQPDIEAADVVTTGRAIRNHEAFAPAGTNVNFLQVLGNSRISVRTYERGVEDETLACGTGCVASSLVMAAKHSWTSPVNVNTRSGAMLRIYFKQTANGFEQVYLEGDARLIYAGTLWDEAWKNL